MNCGHLRYAISDRNLGRNLGCVPPVEQAQRLAAEGVDFYQLREKDLPAAELAELARAVLGVLAGTGMRLLINGRADVAAAVGADGVHLTSSPEELTPRQVREIYAAAQRPLPVVTVSCHTLEDVARLADGPPTAILFGPVFGKTVFGERVMDGSGVDLLGEACTLAAPVPIFALGGATEADTAACVEAGAGGIAGIRLFQR